MHATIRVLPDDVINKIAAGEVIENPSSVVKELVENALDAGATDICVEIRGGGRQLIRISDNGCGMSQDDALLCLERHATSKIRDENDLNLLATMGFRGEALPSIASISKMTLLTRPHSCERGTLLIVEGGKILNCSPAACAPGTTIEVKSLFFNVPVRRKFQKSPTYDANEILRILTLLSLANPNIRFELISNQQKILEAPRFHEEAFDKALEKRISAILGEDFSRSLIPIEKKESDYHIRGFVGSPSASRHNRSGQYLFINQRAVVSSLVSIAVKEGFGTMLAAQRFPIFVFHMTIPSTCVDVNVHPQKKEVRLRHEQWLRMFVSKAVGGAFLGKESLFAAPTLALPSLELPWEMPSSWASESLIPPVESTQVKQLELPKEETLFKNDAFTSLREELKTSSNPYKERQITFPKVIATFPSYIVAEDLQRNCLVVIDQKAAHSRIIFEKLLKNLESSEQREVQSLLIPLTLELSPLDGAFVREQLPCFHAIGFGIREFGSNAFLVDAIPPHIEQEDLAALLLQCVHSFRESSHEENGMQRERQLALVASRNAMRKERKLSLAEAQALVKELMNCHSHSHCPYGKPILIDLEIDKIFKKMHSTRDSF